MTFHLNFTWTIVIIIIIPSHKHICPHHVDFIKHKSNSVTVRIQRNNGLIPHLSVNYIFSYPLEKIPLCELSPSLSLTIITRHNLDRDDYWVSKASATAYYRHIELSVSHERWPGAGCQGTDDRPRCHYPLTRSCNLQSGDVDIVTHLILGHGSGCQLYLLHHHCLVKWWAK